MATSALYQANHHSSLTGDVMLSLAGAISARLGKSEMRGGETADEERTQRDGAKKFADHILLPSQ